MIRTIAGGGRHPLPTSPSKSSVYSSRRKPTTPFAVRASGRSSEVEGDSFPWNTGSTPVRDARKSILNDRDPQSLRFHSGPEASQVTPTSQHQRRSSQPDSPSVLTSASNPSKTDVSLAERPPEPQNETLSKEQQAVLLVEDNNINMQVCSCHASCLNPPSKLPPEQNLTRLLVTAATQSPDEKTQTPLRHGVERPRGVRPLVHQP